LEVSSRGFSFWDVARVIGVVLWERHLPQSTKTQRHTERHEDPTQRAQRAQREPSSGGWPSGMARSGGAGMRQSRRPQDDDAGCVVSGGATESLCDLIRRGSGRRLLPGSGLLRSPLWLGRRRLRLCRRQCRCDGGGRAGCNLRRGLRREIGWCRGRCC
jgi:hypothetical protein